MTISKDQKTEVGVLPNFVGIGASKSGSTWLHDLLQSHPQIFMPTKRKEINFFSTDDNYARGLEWYSSYFPDVEESQEYGTIGEISPRYLIAADKSAQRISSVDCIQKFLLILRNPVDRAYSQYCHSLRAAHYDKSFEEYIVDRPIAISTGLYHQKLLPFLDYFEKEQFCFLIFENAIKNPDETKSKLAEFLDVDPNLFPEGSGSRRSNKSYVPKYKFMNYWAAEVNRQLVKYNLDGVVNLADSLGVRKFLQSGGKKSLPKMKPETRTKLLDIYSEDVTKLEQLLGINLDIWRR